MKLYRADYPGPAPVVVEAEVPRYPHRDADGVTIHDNTHFAVEAEAWERLLREAHAAESLELRHLQRIEKDLEEARAQLLKASRAGIAIREAHRAWKAEQL